MFPGMRTTRPEVRLAPSAALWLLAGALVVAPPSGAAQVVVGTVTEAVGDRPVAGAMVRLLAEEGAGPRYLTAADGGFLLRAPRAGTWWLRVDRIGFTDTWEGPVEVPAGDTVRMQVVVASPPVRLPGPDGGPPLPVCSPGEDGEGPVALLWGEARKALAAASWTDRSEGLRIVLEQRVRRLDPSGETVTDEQRNEYPRAGANRVRSLPPQDLAEGGYVREVDGLVYYYGPDPDALLSDAFLETHCFRVVPGPADEPHLVGLSFEPVPARDTTDIAGVLLLDGATGRLDRVEFRYTGLRAEAGREQARGAVRFLGLSDGRWVVREWLIRAPVLTVEATVGDGGRVEEEAVLDFVQEFDSRIRALEGSEGVSWRDGGATGRLRGVVWDSVQARALAGAEVRLAGRGWHTRTDDEGRWTLEDIPPGRYRVSFVHPRLDTLGIDPGGREVAVESDATTEVRLAVPPLDRLLALPCPEPRGGVVVGRVLDAAGRSLPGVEVAVVAEGGGEGAVASVTGGDGTFRLCGLPPDREVAVEALLGPIRSAPGRVRTVDGAAVRVDLHLGATTLVQGETVDTLSRPILEGSVVEQGSDQPLEGVVVALVDEDGQGIGQTVTGADGEFRIAAGRAGRYRVRAERLAYGRVEDHPVVIGQGPKRVQIRMVPEALEMEGVVVEVAARSRRLQLAGFYARRAQGLGLLLDREALDAMNLSQTGDIVHRVGGLTVLSPSTRGSMDTNRRFLTFRRASRADGCMPAIFVDGNQIRQGGRWRSGMPTLDEIIPADEVEALELYDGPASVPSQFSSMGGACGVVVVWTRSTPERR